MVTLVTLETAKLQLRIPVSDTSHDAEVQLKADQASDILVNYLSTRADPEWTPETVPPRIAAGILLMLTHLYEHRGDDLSPTTSGETPDADVWLAIDRLLKRDRDPAWA